MKNNNLLYSSFADYSPRGTSDVSKKSRIVCGKVKAARHPIIIGMCDMLSHENAEHIKEYLNDNTTLVPIPRSSPLKDGATWPSKTIADILVNKGYGKEVYCCLKRKEAIRKSAYSSSNTRPTVHEHCDTLEVVPDLTNPTHITLIDDVVTAGRTAVACALKLQEVYPNAEIKLFTILRTESIGEIAKVINPSQGRIQYYNQSGRTFRHNTL